MKVGKNFLKMVEIYRHFARDQDGLDWSDKAMVEMYLYESTGHGSFSRDSSNTGSN